MKKLPFMSDYNSSLIKGKKLFLGIGFNKTISYIDKHKKLYFLINILER